MKLRLDVPLALFLCLSPIRAADYKLSPQSVERKASYTLKVTIDPCDAKNKLSPDTELETATSGLIITDRLVAEDRCDLTAKLTVQDQAAFGRATLNLVERTDSARKLLKALSIEVAAVTPEPTPPGLGQKVDIMWKVLPWRQVADSYGKKVADQYFAVELTVGNNAGYSLLIESIGFLAPSRDIPWPNDAYSITRSTIEREQQVGTRAMVLNSIAGAAGVATATSPFFKNQGHLAQFGVFVGLGNPILEGLRLIWPDKTVRHLIAMDTRVFRGPMIIKNNEPKSIYTFISREMVECKKDCAVKKGTRLDFSRKGFHPLEVMNGLGQVVLVGHEIEYINRVRVVSREAPSATPVPPVVQELPTQARTLAQSGTLKLKLTGNGLANVVPSVPDDSGLRVSQTTNDPNGKFTELTVEAGLDAAPGRVTMAMSTVGGVATLDLIVRTGTPKVTDVKPAEVKIGTETSVTLTGEFLNRARINAPPNVKVNAQPASDDDERKGKKLVLKITPQAGAATGSNTVGLTRDGVSVSFVVTVIQ
ncbi:MAG: hypothetical protein HY235_06260 [Acidobacteria bacterium]|nr:hypothetical protein [Acidobacteriota bacterium]